PARGRASWPGRSTFRGARARPDVRGRRPAGPRRPGSEAAWVPHRRVRVRGDAGARRRGRPPRPLERRRHRRRPRRAPGRAGLRRRLLRAVRRARAAAGVRRGRAAAVEASEGTTETIRRGLALAGPGAVVVKAVAPDNDYRFDVPSVGPETLEVMAAGGAAALAIETARVLVLEREQAVEIADRHGIALVGVAGDRDGGA